MPQLGRLGSVNYAQREQNLGYNIPFSLTIYPASANINSSITNVSTLGGPIRFGYNATLGLDATYYTFRPSASFYANVMLWGAGGGAGGVNGSIFGGGGGFTTGIVYFVSGTSYNIVVGTAGTRTNFLAGAGASAGGGGGASGIEYLANAIPIIIAGGGGGGGVQFAGGGGGGYAGEAGAPSANNMGSATGLATSPAAFKVGGVGTANSAYPIYSGGGVGGIGYAPGGNANGGGGGGGGLYGGAGGAAPAGGAGGGGFIDFYNVVSGNYVIATANTAGDRYNSSRNGAGEGGRLTIAATDGCIIISPIPG